MYVRVCLLCLFVLGCGDVTTADVDAAAAGGSGGAGGAAGSALGGSGGELGGRGGGAAGAAGAAGAGAAAGSGGAAGAACTPAVVDGVTCSCGGTCAPCPLSYYGFNACEGSRALNKVCGQSCGGQRRSGCTLNLQPYQGCVACDVAAGAPCGDAGAENYTYCVPAC